MLEPVPFFGARGPSADFELGWTNLDRRDRARQQILVPAWMRWGAVPGCNDDVAVAIFTEAEHRRPFLAGFCAGCRQEHECPPSHPAAELSVIRSELLDQLLVERVHIGRDLGRGLSIGRFWTHELRLADLGHGAPRWRIGAGRPWIVLVAGRIEHTVSLFTDLGEIGVLRRRRRIGTERESSFVSRPRDGCCRLPAAEVEIGAVV